MADRLDEIRARADAATPGPWADLAETYYQRCQEDKRKQGGRWYHGSRRASLPLVLIARAEYHGEPIDPEDIPRRIDKFDLETIIGLFWSTLPKRTTVAIEGFFKPQDAAFIAAARSDIPYLLDRLAASEQEAARLRAERDAANARYAEQVQRLQAAIEQAKEYPCPACGHRLMVACGHDALGATTAPEPERATVARLRADLAASETPYLKLKAFLRSVAERVVRIEGCAGCRELGMAIRVAVVTDWALPTPEDMAAARRVVEALAATTAPEAERAGPE
jgi:hypothetical protein